MFNFPVTIEEHYTISFTFYIVVLTCSLQEIAMPLVIIILLYPRNEVRGYTGITVSVCP